MMPRPLSPRHAFTLIELLVVIAIIAILAAILFPVFAQAKEAAKKTATLAQYKQVGTASQIYLTDYDDLYMLSIPANSATGGLRYNNVWAVPAGWTSTAARDVAQRRRGWSTLSGSSDENRASP